MIMVLAADVAFSCSQTCWKNIRHPNSASGQPFPRDGLPGLVALCVSFVRTYVSGATVRNGDFYVGKSIKEKAAGP